ncbi:MAG TPA: hypothetical protein VIL40_02475, partial [Thermaerobacter sp.]
YEMARYGRGGLALEDVQRVARALRRDLERHFGWRFRWVRLTPDLAVLTATLGAQAAQIRTAAAARWRATRLGARIAAWRRSRPRRDPGKGPRPPARSLARPAGRFVRPGPPPPPPWRPAGRAWHWRNGPGS